MKHINYFGVSKNIVLSLLLLAMVACNSDGNDKQPTPTPPDPTPQNSLPVANAGIDQTVNENIEVTLNASASSDSDGSISSYAWTQSTGTAAALSDPSIPSPTFTAPEVTVSETLTFQVLVTDDKGATAQDSVSIIVNNVNKLPIANAGEDQSVEENTAINLDASASVDEDGTIASYTWSQSAGTPVVLSDSSSPMPTLTAPEVAADETLIFDVTVTDNQGGTAQDSVSIVVTNVNIPPTASAGPDQTVDELTEVMLSGISSADPDGTIVAFSWQQTAGPNVTLNNSNQQDTDFTAPDVDSVEILTFELSVTDSDSAMATDSVDVIVNPVESNTLPESALETSLLLNELYFEYAERIGEKIWVLGFYGNVEVNNDGAGYLVENMLHLDIDQEQPHHSFARLDGVLPPDDWHGNQVLVYGEIKDFAQQSGEPTSQPTPLISIEKFELVSFFEQNNSFENSLLPPDVAPENILNAEKPDTVQHTVNYENYYKHQSYSGSSLPGTQAQSCDRSVIISGGIDQSANYSRYIDNVVAKSKKMKELGFTDEQIEVFYNDGAAINVDGGNIVDSNTSKDKIMDHLMSLAATMPGSCTLTIFVTDHGTGHDPNRNYSGARPAFTGTESTSGALYDENTFSYDARAKTYRSSASFVLAEEQWFVSKEEDGTVKLFRRVGTKWQLQGSNADNDNIISETELGGIDLDGDGIIENDFGFSVERLEARLTGRNYRENAWDSDRDGNVDIRVRHDGSRFVFERLVGSQWMEMGRDTNGDFFIDIIDGGVDWNLDGDSADQVGFHEGINLWGNEVLWDDEFADKLKALSEKGVHVMMEMVSCYSGGFVPNVKDYVENIYTGSSEETPHYNRRQADGTYIATDEIEFLNNLEGIDTDSWNAAADEATAIDTATAVEQGATENVHVHEQTKRFTTDSEYQQSGATDEYLIELDLPDDLVGDIYDFEFILGLQKPRWSSVTFPDGLPDGLQTEEMPGGIRVFSDQPIEDNQIIRIKAADIELTEEQQIRIEFTDIEHKRLGYHMVDSGEVEEPAPKIEFSQPKACVNHTDHGQSSPSILEWLLLAQIFDNAPLTDIAVTVAITIPDGSVSYYDIRLNPAGQAYLLFQIFSFGDYSLEVVDAQLVPSSQAFELLGTLNFGFTVTSDETNKGECAP